MKAAFQLLLLPQRKWMAGLTIFSIMGCSSYQGFSTGFLSLNQFLLLIGITLFCIQSFLLIRERNGKKKISFRLEELKALMNPHFVANSLNAIENLIQKDQKAAASRYLIHFSRLSRKILSGNESRNHSLYEEIDTLQHFLALAELRFQEKFSYQIHVEDNLNLKAIEFPAMLLQPYVENAIWHGIRPKETKGNLEVRISREKDKLACVIEDNGIGRQKAYELIKTTTIKRKAMTSEISSEKMNAINRVRGGSLKVEDLEMNGDPAGTRVTLFIPYKVKKRTYDATTSHTCGR